MRKGGEGQGGKEEEGRGEARRKGGEGQGGRKGRGKEKGRGGARRKDWYNWPPHA